jgi:hypothetical protein
MFDIIVRLIVSLALIWMGLNLFLGPREYKAFAGNLKGPFFCPSVCRLPRLANSRVGNSVDSGRRFLFCKCHLPLAPEIESDNESGKSGGNRVL